MGASNSKSSSSASTTNEHAASSPIVVTAAKEENATVEATSAPPKSACPMHNGDGTYRFSLWAGLPPNHPTKQQDATIHEKENEENTPAAAAEPSKCPVQNAKSADASSAAAVEYNVYGQPIDPRNQMPHNPNQLPAPQQTIALSTNRVASTIPKGGGAAPQDTTWLYPSPQMFYNALQRKHKLPEELPADDIEAVVRIHNQMNEATWHKIRQWEALSSSDTISTDTSDTVKLLKFQGRPTDLSPKAALKHYLLGHPLPFDRHDWIIERSAAAADGGTQQQRYVLDYYYNAEQAPHVMVDVRPALDSLAAGWQRAVTMPLAIWQKQTPFAYLPLYPARDMQAQVVESVQVWRQIQNQAANVAPVQQNVPPDVSTILPQFQTALHACQKEQAAVANGNDDDDDIGAASLQLSLCLGQVLCPIQVSAFSRVLDQEENDKDGSHTAEAFDRLQQCLALKSQQYKQAKESSSVVKE